MKPRPPVAPHRMKLVRVFVALGFLTAAALGAGEALAQDPPLPFLHALQDHGYGDMAIEYLKLLEKQRAVPPEIRESWDLEMSKSYRAAASDAYDAKDYERLMAEAQRYLEKFINENRDHPEAVAATAEWAEFLARRALELIRQAKNVEKKDKEQCESLLADARASLADARTNVEQAQKRFRAQPADLPPASASSSKKAPHGDTTTNAREQADARVQALQFQLALLDYWVAQTYLDPKGARHVAALKKAAKAFDAVYQHERVRGTTTALYAHMWHGKTCEELGDLQTALDIYDEVLANDMTGMEPLFAQVEYFRLQILARQDPKKFLPEATAWLKE